MPMKVLKGLQAFMQPDLGALRLKELVWPQHKLLLAQPTHAHNHPLTHTHT